jgi:hypothetical protein
MKNVTKILTVVTLCATLFGSAQRIDALGGNAALWPGDEANIAAFPAQVNNHGYVQLSGVGTAGEDNTGGVGMVFQNDATTWGFNYGDNDDWVSMSWGDGSMGVSVALENTTGADASGDASDMSVSYGNSFDWGEIGVHYATTDNGDGDATLGFDYRTDWGFWLFDNTVAHVGDLMADDLAIDADFFTHMDAGGADVVYGWGFAYDGADGATTLSQSATVGVEANMTDWATLRAGYNWTHEVACDSADDSCGANTSGFAWGLGFNWGGLTADYTVDSGLLLDPVGTITGNNDAAGGNYL